jgi:hypothetical protein
MKLPDPSPNHTGKILHHDAGIGEADQDMIEQRARELAEIAGLAPNQVTNAHRLQARRELGGTASPDEQPADDDPRVSELISYDDAPGSSGRPASPATNAAANSDEETIGEQLYSEGVAEADHDRMTESRKADLADQREDNSAR